MLSVQVNTVHCRLQTLLRHAYGPLCWSTENSLASQKADTTLNETGTCRSTPRSICLRECNAIELCGEKGLNQSFKQQNRIFFILVKIYLDWLLLTICC